MTGSQNTEEITLPSVQESIPQAAEYIRGRLVSFGCPLKMQLQFAIVADEICSNICKFAYPDESGTMTVRLTLGSAPGREQGPPSVFLSFIDQGIPYNPLSAPAPDITLSAKERKLGGLGVHITKHLMDDAVYEYKDGRNILRLRKDLA